MLVVMFAGGGADRAGESGGTGNRRDPVIYFAHRRGIVLIGEPGHTSKRNPGSGLRVCDAG